MSNLSELLPTGGGQNAVDFVASGTLASGQTVALKTDGTVEAVAATATVIGTAQQFEAANTVDTSSAYDTNSNKVVIVYTDAGNSNYPTAIVASVSGTTLTFGSPVVWQSATASKYDANFDPDNNKIVVFYQTQLGGVDNSGTGIVGTVSGTGISFGTPTSWMTKSNNAWSSAYDTTANKFVGHYYDNGNSNHLYGVVATVSGTSISFGTPVVVRATVYHYDGGTVYDSNANKIIYAYGDQNDNKGYAGIGTVSGTSISYTTAQEFTASCVYSTLTYDPISYKTLLTFTSASNQAQVKTIVVTNNSSSLTFGTEATAFTSTGGNVRPGRQLYEPSAPNIVLSYVEMTSNNAFFRSGSISGTSFTFSGSTDLGVDTDSFGMANSISYNSDLVNFTFPFRDQDASNYGKALVFSVGASNNTSFIGITSEAIANTATGAVNVFGGINTVQTGLTIASDYYVQGNGTLSTASASPAIKVGQAISATTINMKNLT